MYLDSLQLVLNWPIAKQFYFISLVIGNGMIFKKMIE